MTWLYSPSEDTWADVEGYGEVDLPTGVWQGVVPDRDGDGWIDVFQHFLDGSSWWWF